MNSIIISSVLLVLYCQVANALSLNRRSLMMSTSAGKKVLIVGGTRFSGLYLWKELHQRGHSVTLFNRGKTPLKKLPKETDEEFETRSKATNYIKGDRKNPESLKEQLGSESFDVIYDMNGREAADTIPLVDMFKNKVEHFVYMSSAGVYQKSPLMPHFEGDAEDENSRHKGKLETERYMQESGIPFTSIRPTYIYGPMNYNPLEEYFFSRLTDGRTICIPGDGQWITGLGHVEDLATAMAQVIGRDKCKGEIYNIQDIQSITFEGLAQLCGKAAGIKPKAIDIRYYDKSLFDFGKKKAFPMREQHFFCSVDKAMRDLDWTPKYSMIDGLIDSYNNDFKIKKESGGSTSDYSCDDLILNDDRVVVKMFDGLKEDKISDVKSKYGIS